MKHIYLDTNLWNELHRQGVDARSLLTALRSEDARLVLGDENVYECTKTFFSKTTSAHEDGISLFRYLQTFTSEGIPVTKVNMDLITGEMQALQLNIGIINPFVTPDEYPKVEMLIRDHAKGILQSRTRVHIEWRRTSGASERAGLVMYLKNMPVLKHVLMSVSRDQFPAWVRVQSRGRDGTNYLAWQIKQYFAEHPFNEAYEYACALQRTPVNRISMGVISRNLYFNWRCAHRVSIPPDLFPDSNHIINANYCDVYATKERGQLEYARFLLTPATAIHIYDAAMPIDRWILSTIH